MSGKQNNQLRVWPGRILSAIAIAGWVLFAWLLTHRSLSPEYFGRYSPEYMIFLGFLLAGVFFLTAIAYLGVSRPGVLRFRSIGSSIVLLSGSVLITGR